MADNSVEQAYALAKESYQKIGVDTDKAIDRLKDIPVSIHCWQGDDVAGFEKPDTVLEGGGIQATGNYPGKARSIDELRADFQKALSLIPGNHRLNLHASYLDNRGNFVDRDEIAIEHFQSWIDWATDLGIGMDFNPTYFSHPKAADGFTLSHSDKGIRKFWIEHGITCRKIAAEMGRQLNSPSVVNFWIPDGYKDIPANRYSPRERLTESLDAIFAEQIDPTLELDAVESKLFGIGAESYTVGSHEFYTGYAVSRQKLLCLDAGHFHPTEQISDKISALLPYVPALLLHVSRPVRWDSDHVVILNDELQSIANEIIRSNQLDRIHIGLDFFDASINRVAAWVIGTRSMIKALLIALLTPPKIAKLEADGDYTSRLALQEIYKSQPFGAVLDYYCLQQNVPVETQWLQQIKHYEENVLSKRV
ncbi:MAG: L-rhamnose isomerase [Sedimentisphaerales bacterium]|nr:L-rhamnose isomerase [Sedimentisphaerales bacterium]